MLDSVNQIKYKWKNFIFLLKNLIIYFPIVIKMRPWDYVYILYMIKFQLSMLLKSIENGYEIDRTRLPKEEKMRKVIKLLNNIEKDNFLDRSGYKESENYPLGSEEFHKINIKARNLEKSEWDELFTILKEDMHGWWD